MERQIQIPGYRTIYPNSLYIQEVEGDLVHVIHLLRYTPPSFEEVVNNLKDEIEKLQDPHFSDPDESLTKRGLRDFLRSLPISELESIVDDEESLEYLKQFFEEDSDMSYFTMRGCEIDRKNLSHPSLVEKFGPGIYGANILEHGHRIWYARLLQRGNEIMDFLTLTTYLSGQKQDEEEFLIDCDSDTEIIYPEAINGIERVYLGLKNDLDVSCVYNEKASSKDSWTAQLIRDIYACNPVDLGIGFFMIPVEDQSPRHLGYDFNNPFSNN